MRNTPLSWLQLTSQRTRLVIASLGIAFAAMLIFVQLGLLEAMYTSNTSVHRQLRADLIMLHAETETFISGQAFSKRQLYRALGFKGVKSVNSFSYLIHNFKNIQTGKNQAIAIFGIEPSDSPFEIDELNQNIELLKLTDVGLFDRQSRAEYGNITEKLDANHPVIVELIGHRIKLQAATQFVGPSFAIHGSIITSKYSLSRIYPQLSPENVFVGLITLDDGANANQVIKNLRSRLPADVKVLTKKEYIDLEENYWKNNTPIGLIFSMGAAIGFVVGVIIVYQILYAEISDRIPDYAILKARGYKSRYFLGLLFQASVGLSIAGYLPGYILASLLYSAAATSTKLPLKMTSERALLVLVLTILMCLMSSVIAARKLEDADPADLI